MNPKVTIIIPAYNAEKYLAETLDSVIAQRYSDWEVVLVNDGSKDSTPKIADDYAAKDARMTVIHQANAGVSTARNRGLSEAKGEYLAFLDADDCWHPDFLIDRVAVLDDRPEVGLVNGLVTSIGPNSEPLENRYRGHDQDAYQAIVDFLPRVTFPSNLLLRRSVFEQIGGFHPDLSNVADKMLVLDFSQVSEIVLLEKEHLIYRIHPGSMHHNLDLMEADYMRWLNILSGRDFFKGAVKRSFYAHIYKICAGAFLQSRNYGRFFRYFFRLIWVDPGLAFSTVLGSSKRVS